MPRRVDADDYLSPGQVILFEAEPSEARPPVDTRVWECTLCGGRNFAIDYDHTLFDPRLAPGRCAERRPDKNQCLGKLARLVI